MTREEGKALGIEKFDEIDFRYWRMQYLWEEIASTSFGEETEKYEG